MPSSSWGLVESQASRFRLIFYTDSKKAKLQKCESPSTRLHVALQICSKQNKTWLSHTLIFTFPLLGLPLRSGQMLVAALGAGYIEVSLVRVS